MSTRAPQLLASWLIGSDNSCDLVVNVAGVSGHHCRLYQYDRQFALEDMGSTNGTYVDGERIPPRAPVIVRPEQNITLGRAVPLPWPEQISRQSTSQHPRDSRVIRIGRSPDSDVVLDYPTVSWEHARIRLEPLNPEFDAWDLDAEQDRYRIVAELDRKSTRLNSSHLKLSRMPSSA